MARERWDFADFSQTEQNVLLLLYRWLWDPPKDRLPDGSWRQGPFAPPSVLIYFLQNVLESLDGTINAELYISLDALEKLGLVELVPYNGSSSEVGVEPGLCIGMWRVLHCSVLSYGWPDARDGDYHLIVELDGQTSCTTAVPVDHVNYYLLSSDGLLVARRMYSAVKDIGPLRSESRFQRELATTLRVEQVASEPVRTWSDAERTVLHAIYDWQFGLPQARKLNRGETRYIPTFLPSVPRAFIEATLARAHGVRDVRDALASLVKLCLIDEHYSSESRDAKDAEEVVIDAGACLGTWYLEHLRVLHCCELRKQRCRITTDDGYSCVSDMLNEPFYRLSDAGRLAVRGLPATRKLQPTSAEKCEPEGKPEGWIAADGVLTRDGVSVPRTTVQKWAEQDEPNRWTDPADNNRVYYPPEWIESRLKRYKRRRKRNEEA